MYVYAGIDEAGYGPMFGPLLVSRVVMTVSDLSPDPDGTDPPRMWQRMAQAVCRNLTGRKGRIAVNDSKKLHTPASGIKHLEVAVLSFASLAGHRPQTVDQWLDCLGERCHHNLGALPWYEPTADQPWSSLPCAVTQGELAVARGLLSTTAKRAGVEVREMGATVVLEDRFNRLVAATRSKASTSFTFVAEHLREIWDRYGVHEPTVVVDRQSGRLRYRQLLAMCFPDAQLRILDEVATTSAYRIDSRPGGLRRAMNVRFEVDGDGRHMPVALASMISKYTRELWMSRFKAWFTARAPQIKPTAGYGVDAKRFWQEVQPVLPALSIKPERLRRSC